MIPVKTFCDLPKSSLKLLRNFISLISNCNNGIRTQINRKIHYKQPSLPSVKEGHFGSRYIPPSNIEIAEEKIKKILSSKSITTTEEWLSLKKELMFEIEILNETNFSSIIMNCFLHINKLKDADIFMQFLKDAHIECNFLTYLKYMDLCSKNIELCGQERIFETFKKVKNFVESTPILDLKSAEHIIAALSVTDQWRRAFEYLKRILVKPNFPIKNSIASAAIRNGDENLAWEILIEWFRREESPSCRTLKDFMLYAQKLLLDDCKLSDAFVKQLFQFMQSKAVIVDEEVIKSIATYFRCHPGRWNVAYSKVIRDRICNSCDRSLEVIDFSPSDFKQLKDKFLEKSIMKGNVFFNTTKYELERYLKFIHAEKPFDIVLDGLNVAHTLPTVKTNKLLAYQLLRVIDHFPNQRLLILARRHIMNWPTPIMKKIYAKARVFLTSNISQDDPFVVYAALESGPHSLVISSDLMRDHYSRLDDPNLIWLFKRWQQTHQIYISPEQDGKLKFLGPLKHSINIQGNMQDGWHIPFDDKFILEPYEQLNNWLCVKRC